MNIARLLCLLPALLSLTPTPACAETRKTLHPGESDVYEFDGMTAAAVGSPAVADIVPLTARRLLVSARAAGETTLFVYDRKGRHKVRLVVTPAPTDLGPQAARAQAEIGLPDVHVRAAGDTLLIEGSVFSVVGSQRAQIIAAIYAPKVRNLLRVVPPAGPPTPTLAQTYADLLSGALARSGVTVRVVDDTTIALSGEYDRAEGAAAGPEASAAVSTRRAKAGAEAKGAAEAEADSNADPTEIAPAPPAGKAGRARGAAEPAGGDPLDRLLRSLPPALRVIDLVNLGRRPTRQILVRAKVIDINRNASKSLGVRWGSLSGGSSRAGDVFTFAPQPILFGQSSGQGTTGAGYGQPFAGGALRRVLPLAAQLDALIQEDKARILSEPSLLVLDGCDGSILVGGEIPVPVAQASSGTGGVSSSITVVYKPYGIRLLVHVALVGGGRIQMTVTPEVSDLNYANAVQISGFVIPALTVRRATSTLQMGDGETLVIGGLYSSTSSRQTERIPLLSQIPVLGEFFKSTTTRRQESELLILIQPQIVTSSTSDVRPPASGTLENLPIARPDVRRGDFDKDFPALQKGGGDRESPRGPVSLPAPEAAP